METAQWIAARFSRLRPARRRRQFASRPPARRPMRVQPRSVPIACSPPPTRWYQPDDAKAEAGRPDIRSRDVIEQALIECRSQAFRHREANQRLGVRRGEHFVCQCARDRQLMRVQRWPGEQQLTDWKWLGFADETDAARRCYNAGHEERGGAPEAQRDRAAKQFRRGGGWTKSDNEIGDSGRRKLLRPAGGGGRRWRGRAAQISRVASSSRQSWRATCGASPSPRKLRPLATMARIR